MVQVWLGREGRRSRLVSCRGAGWRSVEVWDRCGRGRTSSGEGESAQVTLRGKRARADPETRANAAVRDYSDQSMLLQLGR
jgi:hypothetical protein